MDKTDTFWRAISTIVIWALMMVSIIIGSIFLPGTIGSDVIAFYIVIAIAAVISTGFVWNSDAGNRDTQRAEAQQAESAEAATLEKRKRDRLDAVIRTLSDDQLLTLRERLASGEITDAQLTRMLGDDEDFLGNQHK